MNKSRTPDIGEELVIRGTEVIVDRAKFLCEGCEFRFRGVCQFLDDMDLNCHGVIFVPKLEYLKRQMR